MWREVRDWRHHWSTRSFFQALFFGLAFTLLDTGTDISFAWSVPDVCFKAPLDAISSNPCGIVDSMDVEYSAYTTIALPGILFAFSGLQRCIGQLATRCFGGEVHRCFKAGAIVISVIFQVCLWFGLFFAATRKDDWAQDPDIPQGYIDVYAFSIKAMAYASATFIVGVKILGVFCHGPETSRLVLQTTDSEAQFEASHQLLLVSTIFLASGRWTTRSILSGATSILVIGRVGVHNVFNEEKEELAKASLLGKICTAISVLPVFVLTALFKIGSFSVVGAWNEGGIEEIALAFLAIVLPALVLVFLKIHLSLKDLTVTSISQGLMSERVSLHIWPSCEQVGKKIGLAMSSLHLLIYSSFLAWIINNSDPNWTRAESRLYKTWVEDTSTRLQITGILCLVIGWTSFPLIVCQFFFQRRYVANIVASHLSKGEEKNKGKEEQEVNTEDRGQDEGNESQEEGERQKGQGKFATEKVINEERGAKEGNGENREKGY